MSSPTIIYRDCSLRGEELIDDDATPDAHTMDWLEYCRVSSTVDTDDLMATVGEAFSTTDVLRGLIEDAKAHPFRPDERKRLHVSDCLRLGTLVMELIAQAIDDDVGLRQAGQDGRKV